MQAASNKLRAWGLHMSSPHGSPPWGLALQSCPHQQPSSSLSSSLQSQHSQAARLQAQHARCVPCKGAVIRSRQNCRSFPDDRSNHSLSVTGGPGGVLRAQPDSTTLQPQRDTGNGVYLLMLINVVLFLADKVAHLPGITALYLNHLHPGWWQWVTHMFMHANWAHLSNNLFFLLTFGRLVEEGEGGFGVVLIYLVCGLGAAIASFLLSPRASVSVGASGAVFGLFVASVLLRLRQLSLRYLLEAVVLGQFVIHQLWGEVTKQAAGGAMVGGLHVSHLAHLGGALTGVLLVLLLNKLPPGQ